MKVFLQMGHVGSKRWGPGALYEEDVIKIVTPMVSRNLQEAGAEVDLFGGDLPFGIRSRDLFLAIHCDSGGVNSTGCCIGWGSFHRGSKEFGRHLASQYSKQTGIEYDGENFTSGLRGYYGYKYFTPFTPCVLLELGFVSNPDERKWLNNNTVRIAKIISDTILNYFGITAKINEEDDEFMSIDSGPAPVNSWSEAGFSDKENAAYVDIINRTDKPINVQFHIQLGMPDKHKVYPMGNRFITINTELEDGKAKKVESFEVGEIFGNLGMGNFSFDIIGINSKTDLFTAKLSEKKRPIK